MTDPQNKPLPGRKPVTPQTSALSTTVFAIIAFAALTWPAGRMWAQTPRDWEMILPALLTMAMFAVFAVAGIVRFLMLRNRAQRAPRKPRTKPAARTASPSAAADPIDLALEEPEPRFAFTYPDVPAELGE